MSTVCGWFGTRWVVRRISQGEPTRVVGELVRDVGLSHLRTWAGVVRIVWLRMVDARVERSLRVEKRPPPLGLGC